MQYDDFYLRPEFDAVTRSQSLHDRKAAFLHLCRVAMHQAETGLADPRQASYTIAGTMFVSELDDDLFDAITGLAGELELDDELLSGPRDKLWKQLGIWVDEYASALASRA